MKLTYRLNNRKVIDSVDLPLQAKHFYLIKGPESHEYALLPCILAGLIPLKDKLSWEVLQALINEYSGELDIEEGSLFESNSYVGPDPEHHLLFSTVKEELSFQVGFKDPISVLDVFGLNYSYLNREIHSLSGGEKMKLSLAIAFSRPAKAIILHGVVPWLDKAGRHFLCSAILTARNQSACVVLFEHEQTNIFSFADQVFSIFDEKSSLSPENHIAFLQLKQPSFSNLKFARKAVLEFDKVTFMRCTYQPDKNESVLLSNISFSVLHDQTCFIVGHNGAGKSTLAQLAFKILNPNSGTIRLLGNPLEEFNRSKLCNTLCYLSQFPKHQILFGNIGECKKHLSNVTNEFALRLLEKYLMLGNEYPMSLLSTMQMKLLCIISSLSAETRLIILDEPTWGLDANGTNILLQLLKDLSALLENFALLIITHDLNLFKFLDPEVVWLKSGNARIYQSKQAFFSDKDVEESFDIPID